MLQNLTIMPPQSYYCTRPGCPHPENYSEDNNPTCQACGMPLILLGRYQPIKRLGIGGFGETFQAINLEGLNKGYCVIKRLYIAPKYLHLKTAIEKAFQREAKVLESLGDQTGQIPSLYDYFVFTAPPFGGDTDFDYKYLVQQFIDGKDLFKELQQRGRFSEAEIMDVLNQILPVLKLIHSVNYDGTQSIHRDIKPSNIIREQRNNNLVLIDFGAVKQIVPGESDPHKSMVFGSEQYAPPEQGIIAYPCTDLYALAASCIQLLTNDNLDTIRNYANQWQWRNKYPGLISNHLADILDRMLDPNPERRYQSAEDVIAALENPKPDHISPDHDNDPTIIIKPIKPQLLLTLLIGMAAVMMAVFAYRYIYISDSKECVKDPATGIELKCPQDWDSQPNQNVLNRDVKFKLTPPNPPSNPYFPALFISVKDTPEATLSGYTMSYLQELKNKGYTIETSQGITINQRPAYQAVYTNKKDPNTPVRVLETWIIYQGKLYILTYSAGEQFYDQFAHIVERDILPSWQINLPPQS